MKAAKLSTSERLKRVRDVLADGRPYSTMQIIKKANVCAVSAIIAELRCNGLKINCQRKLDRHYYTLVKS